MIDRPTAYLWPNYKQRVHCLVGHDRDSGARAYHACIVYVAEGEPPPVVNPTYQRSRLTRTGSSPSRLGALIALLDQFEAMQNVLLGKTVETLAMSRLEALVPA